jgi:hypothetical protein
VADLNNVSPGQGRIQVDSTSQLSLQRYGGKYIPLKISGAWEAKIIPGAGVTLSNSGLTAATLYYVYAFSSAGTLTLEAVVTAHALDTDTGLRIKSGDASRTLLGAVYMGAGSPGTFVNSVTRRLCLNWFNRRSLDLSNTFSADRSTSGTTFAEINSEIELEFLTWDDEAVDIGISGTALQTNSGQAVATAIGIDSTSVATQATSYTAPGSNSRGPLAIWLSKVLSEGRHFATLLGGVSGGTGTWHTADDVTTGTAKTRLWACVRG